MCSIAFRYIPLEDGKEVCLLWFWQFPTGYAESDTFPDHVLRSQCTAVAQMLPQYPQLSLGEPWDAAAGARDAAAGARAAKAKGEHWQDCRKTHKRAGSSLMQAPAFSE